MLKKKPCGMPSAGKGIVFLLFDRLQKLLALLDFEKSDSQNRHMRALRKPLCKNRYGSAPMICGAPTFSRMPEGYRKDAGRIPEAYHNCGEGLRETIFPACRKDTGRTPHCGNRVVRRHCIFTCTPEEYRKNTGRIPEGSRKRPPRCQD